MAANGALKKNRFSHHPNIICGISFNFLLLSCVGLFKRRRSKKKKKRKTRNTMKAGARGHLVWEPSKERKKTRKSKTWIFFMNIRNTGSKEWKISNEIQKQTNAKWRELGERKYHTTPISTANIDCALYKLGLLYNETSCISLQIPISIDRAIKLTIRILSTNATISVTMKIRNQQSQFFPFNFRQKFKVNLASYNVPLLVG